MNLPFAPRPPNAFQRLGEILNAKATIAHRSVADVDYIVQPADRQVGYTSITLPRTITLPDDGTLPHGELLFIADECGQCSAERPLNIVVGAGSGDTIAGDLGVSLTYPYQGIGFRRGAANVWIIAR